MTDSPAWGSDAEQTASMTRRISASAQDIFALLTDPANHPSLDGSGMLRSGSGASNILSRVGDTFAVRMYHPEIGDYVMLNRVLDYVTDRRLVWEPTPGDEAASTEAGLPIGASQGYVWGFDLAPDGPGATTVTEFFDCTDADDAIRTAVDGGRRWLVAMSETLARLAAATEEDVHQGPSHPRPEGSGT